MPRRTRRRRPGGGAVADIISCGSQQPDCTALVLGDEPYERTRFAGRAAGFIVEAVAAARPKLSQVELDELHRTLVARMLDRRCS